MNYMKVICVAGLTLLGGAAFAQSSDPGKEVGPQVDPATLAPHLETAAPVEPSAPSTGVDTGITEVDYARLQSMPEAQRQEILANPDKYVIINQPK
jgi:hypothetical protein